MFRIARTVKQIFNAARNIHQVASVSINSMVKYCTQSKGYVEDVSNEFTFESFTKILPNGLAAKEQIKASAPIFQSVAKLGSIGSYKILDSAEIRKLIYTRFADEIIAKPKKIVENKNLETKDNNTREHIEDFTTNDITEEFKMFKEQGYDFAATREVLQNRNQDTNQSPKSIFERMKKLSIAGYLSNYAGDDGLMQDIEDVMHKKAYVMQELSLRVLEFPACEVQFDQLKQVDILGDH